MLQIKYAKLFYIASRARYRRKIFSVIFLLLFSFFRSFSILHFELNKMYNEINVSLFINETKKYIYLTDKFISQGGSCLKTLWKLSFFLYQNSNIRDVEEFIPFLFLYIIWHENIFYMPFTSLGIVLVKQMVKHFSLRQPISPKSISVLLKVIWYTSINFHYTSDQI